MKTRIAVKTTFSRLKFLGYLLFALTLVESAAILIPSGGTFSATSAHAQMLNPQPLPPNSGDDVKVRRQKIRHPGDSIKPNQDKAKQRLKKSVG
jgi:hypothetical protein